MGTSKRQAERQATTREGYSHMGVDTLATIERAARSVMGEGYATKSQGKVTTKVPAIGTHFAGVDTAEVLARTIDRIAYAIGARVERSREAQPGADIGEALRAGRICEAHAAEDRPVWACDACVPPMLADQYTYGMARNQARRIATKLRNSLVSYVDVDTVDAPTKRTRDPEAPEAERTEGSPNWATWHDETADTYRGPSAQSAPKPVTHRPIGVPERDWLPAIGARAIHGGADPIDALALAVAYGETYVSTRHASDTRGSVVLPWSDGARVMERITGTRWTDNGFRRAVGRAHAASQSALSDGIRQSATRASERAKEAPEPTVAAHSAPRAELTYRANQSAERGYTMRESLPTDWQWVAGELYDTRSEADRREPWRAGAEQAMRHVRYAHRLARGGRIARNQNEADRMARQLARETADNHAAHAALAALA